MELKNIGRYEIKRELGRGGMATVYLAYDPSFDREVAIKILPREFLHNPEFLDRFKREIRTIAQLEHPAIVPVYDVGEHEGMPYLVMRFMPGGSLSDRIATGRFSLGDTARMVERLAAALSYAHRKGVIHRDLKPDNILFNADHYSFISDFGIAKFTEAQTNLTGSGIIGTPAYMSPEQATGDKLDHRSDVYALGVIAYQMLTGQQPYKADTPMGVAIKHVTDPVPEILTVAPDLPEAMNEVMKTVLAKDREKRYPTAVEFARALNQVTFGSPGNIQESMPTIPPTEARPPVRRPVPAGNPKLYVGGAIGVIVVVLSIFAALKLFAGSPESHPTAASLFPATAGLTEAASSAPACSEQLIPAYSSLIRETKRGCTNGAPYTNYLIPKGATFTVQDSDVKCSFVTSREDGDVITCTGKEQHSFKIEFCNLPDAPQLLANSSQCPAGSGYDESNQCCAPISETGQGCLVYNAGTRSCN